MLVIVILGTNIEVSSFESKIAGAYFVTFYKVQDAKQNKEQRKW